MRTLAQEFVRAAVDAAGIMAAITILYAALWAVWGG